MTTATVTIDDLMRLRDVMTELLHAGRTEELEALARVHAAVQGMILDEYFEDDDDDPELLAAIEESERDYEAGRWIPHEEMVRRLEQLNDG